MKCILERDQFGRVLNAKTEAGLPSELFNKVASQPFVQTMDDAVEVIALYNNWLGKVSRKEPDTYSTGEPRVFYRTPQGFTESYREALTKSGGLPVEFGFKDTSGNILPITTVSTNLGNGTVFGIVNNAIVNNQLNEVKEFDGEGYSLKGVGSSNMESEVSASNVFTELETIPDNPYQIFNNGTIRIPYPAIDLSVVTEEGAPAVVDALKGTGASTQEFFGNVVTGGDARYEPSKPYEYEENFSGSERAFQTRYDQKMGNFDQHIATSIPTFRETQIKKGAAIVRLFKFKESPVVYDLGGSEGSWVKTITEESNGNIKTINLDPSPEMQASFDRNKPENSEMSLEAFYQGWDNVKTHQPKEKADVVHESMMFQFIDNNGERADYIKEVKDKYLKEGGLFLTEEKFQMNSPSEYQANEDLKVPHKDKYYTKEQQSLKADQVLVGMKENQANYSQYLSELREQFEYVQPYWFSGNFRGIVATDNKELLDEFLEELGPTSNPRYTFSPTISDTSSPQDLQAFKEKFERELQEIENKAIEDGTFMLAPNGKKTNLSEREWLITRHPNFISWFGDFINDPENASKVVDENGDPRKVYHGSGQMGFHSFNDEEANDGGHFFAGNIQMARSYTKNNVSTRYDLATTAAEAIDFVEYAGGSVDIEQENGETSYTVFDEEGREEGTANTEEELVSLVNSVEFMSPGVGSFFVNLRSPSVIDGFGDNWDDIKGVKTDDLSIELDFNPGTDEFILREFDGSNVSFSTLEEVHQYVEDSYGEWAADRIEESYEDEGLGYHNYTGDPETGEQAPFGQTTREWVSDAKDWEADGTIFLDIDDNGPHGYSGSGDVFVVFDPADIKAIDNVGQFDVQNKDVRFSIIGEGRNISTNQSEIENVLAPIAEVMRQNVAGNSVNILNSEEILEVLKSTNNASYSKGAQAKGFVIGNDVYLNSDLMTLDTPFHEIGHLWLESTKINNPELYNRGVELMRTEGKVYTDYVKQTQPDLVGDEILEEALAQAIGENGAQILDKSRNSNFKQWLSDFFDWIADQVGISQYVEKGEVGELTLEQFSTAVAVEMIKTQTVDGLITSPTGTSGNLKNNGKFIPTEGKGLDVKNYPSEMVTPLEVLSLEDVIKQYEGRVIFTTSDATGVSKDQNGNPVLGGPAYIMLKENVEGKIGFASVDSDTANSTATRAFKMGNGKPVAVLVMVQQGATSLGNYYGSTFLYEGIKEIKSSLSKEEFARFVDDLTEVSKAFLTEHVVDVPRKKFKAKPHHDHFLETFQRFKNQEPTLEEYHQVVTADTNFNFSRSFLQTLFNNVHQVPSKSTKGTKEYIESLTNVKRVFSEIGHDYNKFSTQYNDVNLVDHNDVNEKLYGAVAGFEMRTDFSSPSEMHSEYIAPAQTRGITHPQFNGKLPSDRSFILDSMYKINENFGDFVPKKVSLKEEYLDRRDELEEEGYTQSEADAIIAHEIGPEAFVPTMEYNSNPQAQISQGMGLPMMDEAEFATGIFKYATKTNFSISENPFNNPEIHPTKPTFQFVKVGDTEVSFREGPGIIQLAMIETSAKARGTGSATMAMNYLTAYADSLGKDIELFVAPRDRATSEERLIDFYHKFGFRQKYGGIEQEMIRNPRRSSPDPKNTIKFSVAVHDETGFITPESMVKIVAANNPSYLENVVNHIATMGDKLKQGNITTRDVAKAYLITVSSTISREQSVASYERATGLKVDEVFISKNKIRPESAMASFLQSESGRVILDKVEAGTLNREDLNPLVHALRPFGGWSSEDGKLKNIFHSEGDNKINLKNLTNLTNTLRKGTSTEEEIFSEISKLVGVSAGKTGFVAQFLGIGTRGVIDAREIQGWLTGRLVMNSEYTPEQRILSNKLLGNTKQSKLLQEEILRRMEVVASQFGIPKEFAQYLGHHMVWDALGKEQTSHEEIYRLMRDNAPTFDAGVIIRRAFNPTTDTVEDFKDLIQNGRWGMLTAENPDANKYDEAANRRANQRATQWLREKGYNPINIKGKYVNEENSFLIEGMTQEDAYAFAKEFRQDSVATNEGLIYRDGTYNPINKGSESFDQGYEDFYSTITIQGQPLTYAVDYSNDRLLIEPITHENSKLYPDLTEDGEGNFVFNHWSREKRDVIQPGSSGNGATDNSESGAWSMVGGTSYFYTKEGDLEAVLRAPVGHIVKIPKERVYDLSTDRQGFGEEAKRRFEERNGNLAYTSNHRAAYISKVATEKGYLMTVTPWNGTARGQSLVPIQPSDFYVPGEQDFSTKYLSNEKRGLGRPTVEYPKNSDGLWQLMVDLEAKYVPERMESIRGKQRIDSQIKKVNKSTIPNEDKLQFYEIAAAVYSRAWEDFPKSFIKSTSPLVLGLPEVEITDPLARKVIEELAQQGDIDLTCSI